MFSLKPIIFFAVKIFTVFVLLTILFSWWGQGYTKIANKVNTFFFEDYGSNGFIRFRIDKPQEKPFLVKMEILSKKMIAKVQQQAKVGSSVAAIKSVSYQFDIWLYASLPIIVVLSFILASPVPPIRMLKAIVLGIIITQLFIIFKIGITITNETHIHSWLQIDDSWWQVFFANPTATSALTHLFRFVGFSLMIGVITWVSVTFNGKDWRKFNRIFNNLKI